METIWDIKDISAIDGLITQVRYYVSASQGSYNVDTEGCWEFRDPKMVVPFNEVTKEMIVEWVKGQTMQDGQNMVESRLLEQIESLKETQKINLPWLPQVFTPEI
jgi:hypothetical protein